MAPAGKQPKPGNKLPVFPVACWALGLMAFSQLLVAGMALATRYEESGKVRVVEKEVLRSVIVRVPARPEPSAVARPPASVPSMLTVRPAPEPTPLAAPRIADPRSERLVDEAREARVAGDMGRAVIKLEDAMAKSPEDPSVLYELGLVHEQMGVFDTAAKYYQKVFNMNLSGAGTLYEMAARKLADGFEPPDAMHGKLALGRIRVFNNSTHQDGQKVILTIPVQKAPGDEIENKEIEVSVTFFNRTTKGEIVKLEDKSWVSPEEWVTGAFDWAGGEEQMRMTYTIPKQDRQTAHLFGNREYYGQIVTLLYKGEVLDVKAGPRDLAARIQSSPAVAPGDWFPPGFQDSLPPDFDPTLPLLPTRNGE